LSGHVERQRIGAVTVEDMAQTAGGFADGGVHGDPHRVVIALLTQVSVFHAPGLGDGLAARSAFGAQAANVGRVGLVADHLDHLIVFHLHHDAAANATIRTHATYALVCHPSPSKLFYPPTKKRPATLRLETGVARRLCREWAISVDCFMQVFLASHAPGFFERCNGCFFVKSRVVPVSWLLGCAG